MSGAAVTAIALAFLAGPLLAGGAAKLIARQERLTWPIRAGILAPPAGPRLVGGGELAAAAAICLLPARAAAAVALAGYAALTVTAYLLRGERCACFGVARLAAVGRLHIVANGAGVIIAGVLTAAAPDAELPLRLGGCAVAAAATLAAVLAADRHRTASEPACPGPVSRVHLYVSAGCAACRALLQLLADAEPGRKDAVTVTTVDRASGTGPPERLTGTPLPCAVALSPGGEEICRPVSGLGPAWAVIQTIVIGPRVHAE
jgi:hypothetical protein